MSDLNELGKTLFEAHENLRLLMRPAWVYLISSIGEYSTNQRYLNVAPFSLVMEASHTPPRVLVNLKHETDTYRNVMQSGEFVLNLCTPKNIPAVRASAQKIPYGVSELTLLNKRTGLAAHLEKESDNDISDSLSCFLPQGIDTITPGLAESPLNLWCRLNRNDGITLTENCYRSSATRTILLADVFAAVGDDDYFYWYQGLRRLNPEKPVLVAYGADTYGAAQGKPATENQDYKALLQSFTSFTLEKE